MQTIELKELGEILRRELNIVMSILFTWSVRYLWSLYYLYSLYYPYSLYYDPLCPCVFHFCRNHWFLVKLKNEDSKKKRKVTEFFFFILQIICWVDWWVVQFIDWSSVSDWLIDKLINLLNNWLIKWLTKMILNFDMNDKLVDNGLIFWLIDWLIDWLISKVGQILSVEQLPAVEEATIFRY